MVYPSESWRTGELPKIKDKYTLEKQKFYRYLQMRDSYGAEIKGNPSFKVNGMIRTDQCI